MIDLKLLPTSAYLAAIAALSLALIASVGVQQVRISNVRTELATEKADRAEEKRVSTQAALDHKTAISKLEHQHAAAQQMRENEYAKTIQKLDAEKRADAATADRLRDKIAAFAARDRRPGETDAAAVERYSDRLGILGGLLGEGVGLVVEGRTIVGRRDAEVARLLDQIMLDRAACSPVEVK